MAAHVEQGDTADGPGRARRRGPRRGGEDTRSALVAAARVEFAGHGFDGATVRAIADRAGVDPGMVKHWFGGKDGLFAAAMELPVDPDEIVPRVLAGDPDRVGERIVRTFLAVWDAGGGGPMAAMIRSVAGHERAAAMLRDFIARRLIGRIVRAVAPDRVELRAALCGTQVVGLGLIRYVIRLEPLASADHDTVVAAVAPTVQRYLTGPLDGAVPPGSTTPER